MKGDFDRFRPVLAHYLDLAAARLPKISASVDGQAQVAYAALEAQYHGWNVLRGDAWTLVEVSDPAVVPDHPLGRTLYVHRVSDPSGVTPFLSHDAQTLGVYPWELSKSYREEWARAGVSRIVELGLARHPRKGFTHDGMRALNGLVRVVAVERGLYDQYKYGDEMTEEVEDALFFRR